MGAILPLVLLFLIRLAPAIAFQCAAVAAPVIGGLLGLNHAQLGVVLGAFMLPGIAVTVPAGGASHGSGSPGLNAVLNAVLNAPC